MAEPDPNLCNERANRLIQNNLIVDRLDKDMQPWCFELTNEPRSIAGVDVSCRAYRQLGIAIHLRHASHQKTARRRGDRRDRLIRRHVDRTAARDDDHRVARANRCCPDHRHAIPFKGPTPA
ncbi:hypothetical protein BOSE62_130384 [Bosea sp. 62]|nr:hypothetical protein BOSE7B_120389 [Bosea sp. 7B]CAD5277742.1 hypothetical protein BOSE21B_30526 [Bosea sp. 21B]CAD5278758.1 hypothetical protein BOSE46_40167 [Bosea sp. 46]VVT59736.1 hypothetical protein BOS5A_210527 [Bosea sp. EC-HK365B]VXB41506.1 hypothetical protein BOSE62_130384 [Bosea sp. 62]VXC02704.1 hypothetical protein BOSE127_170027 [Bosea sp. 127]VXC27436.1 hypothetical protein BOSE29B_30494 [Bosea sp. 29B]VXC77482.1 hypothetical protein BOSE125_50166 [Bosea sp. 125]